MAHAETVLVTGAAGFIGSNLTHALLEKGYGVLGIDNFSQGFLRNLDGIQQHPKFRFIEGDVSNAGWISELAGSVDAIAHLAAFKIPRYGNALATLKTNTSGTENILEAARSRKIRVVLASTSDVYGKNPAIPFSEESDSVIGNSKVKRWGYAVSKLFDEHLAFAYHDEFGVPVVILRYFGGYGPRQNPTWWGGPQSAFMQAILENKPLEIHGNGTQTRSFTHVSDTVAGTIAAIEKPEAAGEIFNIGSTAEITILDLARKVWASAGHKDAPPLVFKDYTSFSGKYEDVLRRVPDVRKAEKILGFKATKPLEEGLRETFLWQKGLTTNNQTGNH